MGVEYSIIFQIIWLKEEQIDGLAGIFKLIRAHSTKIEASGFY